MNSDNELDDDLGGDLDDDLDDDLESHAEAEVDALLAFDAGEPDIPGAWQALQGRAPPRSSPSTVRWLVAAAVAAAAVLTFAWLRGPSASSGELAARTRQTIEIGHRGVAVVEPGAAVRWEVDEDGTARVQQSAGAVFYRVNEGDTFAVDTPAGRATVTGTCFTLELDPMRNETKMAASAVAGAAAAAAVMLTVHEGSVVLANDAGTIEAHAGQTARSRADAAPRLDDPNGDDRSSGDPPQGSLGEPPSQYASLVRENIEQRRALRDMQTELAAARGDAAPNAAEPDEDSPEFRRRVARRCAVNGDCDERIWTDPSAEELRELARCGRVLVDTPAFLNGADFFPPGYVIESAGLSEEEAARYAEIAERLYEESGDKYAEFALELDIPAELVDRLAPYQRSMLVDSVVDDWEETLHNVANERAGLSTPPAEQSAGERALRYHWTLGGEFERRLAAEFGAGVAAKMRRAAGGWGNKFTWGGPECID